MDNLVLKILIGADKWARHVLRQDRVLDAQEQELMDAVLEYQQFAKTRAENPIQIPKLPPIPRDLYTDKEEITSRYSDIPTVPSPAFGILAVHPETMGLEDIPEIDIEGDEWIGKQK